MAVLIMVGSESGNSVDFAERAGEDLERSGIASRVVLMDDCPLEELADVRHVLFVCSTTGDGQEPANMRTFMQFLLRADLPTSLFSHVKYAVFGLGDSGYDRFNYVGKRVYRRMAQLGAIGLVGFRGEGDERHPLGGLEAGWSVWWQAVQSALEGDVSVGRTGRRYEPLEPLPPRITPLLNKPERPEELVIASVGFACTLLRNERITPAAHFQDTRLLTLQLACPTDTHIEPGDVLVLAPQNDEAAVEAVLSLLDWDGATLLYGTSPATFAFADVPFPLSLRQFLREYMDLQRVPNRTDLRRLASLSDTGAAEYSAMHRDKLVELSQDEAEYLDYVWRPRRTVVELLRDFQPTLRVGLERLFQVFVRIRGRQFSIANDPMTASVSPTGGRTVQLCVAMISHTPSYGRGRRPGLFSQWVEDGRIDGELQRASLSRGALRLDPTCRLVFLVATGTGIAPLRAILQRLFSPACHDSRRQVVLYFGCRSLAADYYFAEEWRAHFPQLTVYAAGSRDGPDGTARLYIDDVIRRDCAPLLAPATPEDMCVYVAGHTRLAKLVPATLNELWSGRTFANQSWVDWLRNMRRLQTETWS